MKRPRRNFGITAHVDAGKTTVTEQVLHLAGAIRRPGSVDAGNTVTDHLPEERARGITITAAATHARWRRGGVEYDLNLIDTPGHVDFTVEVERSMRVLDGAVAVFDASQGVEPQSEAVWRQADRYGVPRLVFVNKMDKVGADFAMVLADLRAKLGAVPVPVQWPLLEGGEFVGVADLLELRAAGFDGREQPLPEAARRARERLLETLAERDEGVLEAYLGGGSPAPDRLRRALRAATLRRELFPVLCGSALRGYGIAALLDAVADYLPAPEDLPLPAAIPPGATSALAFKVTTDRHGGLTFVRVYSGCLEAGSYLWNATLGVRERAHQLVKLQADRELAVQRLEAGDIGAVRGLRHTLTGHTLTREGDPPHRLEAIQVPEPVLTLALEAPTAAEQERVVLTLQRFAREDPTLRLAAHPETGELTLAGMGELHLEVWLERLRRESGVTVRASAPRVSYRTTVRGPVTLAHTLKKQTGGSGQYAGVVLEVAPLPRGAGFAFEERVAGGAVPRAFIPAVRTGVEQALTVAAEHPLTDLRVALVGGQSHPEDSSDLAFRAAAHEALCRAVGQAGVWVLEPVMRVEVTAPEAFLGAVLGDLSRRRGVVEGLEARGPVRQVTALVPLEALFGYAGDLRSLSQGRASFSMRPAHYALKP